MVTEGNNLTSVKSGKWRVGARVMRMERQWKIKEEEEEAGVWNNGWYSGEGYLWDAEKMLTGKKKKRTNQSLLPFLPSNFLLVLPNGRNKEQDSWQRKSPSITEIQSWKRTVDYLKLIPALAFLFFFNGDKLSLPLLCPPLLISILAFPLLKLKRHFHIFDHTVTHKHPTIKILSPA